MHDSNTELSVLIQLDKLCEQYESTVRRGESPPIDEYLKRVSASHRSRLLVELIKLELGLLGPGDSSVDEIVQRYERLLAPGEDTHAIRSTIEQALAGRDRNTDTVAIENTASFLSKTSSSQQVGATKFPEIDGYEIQSVLGAGGMGVVYLAVETSLNRPVALKMILDRASESSDHFERFEREARAIAELNDPHFIRIYSFGVHEGRPYMALELVEGGSLEESRQGSPQPERAAATMVRTISQAMSKAHQAGLVHRDLKPHNILLTRDGEPKIADFGLVKRQQQSDSERTEHGRVMGTASYMAPEQSYGQADVGPFADIHALGAILYCLLVGRPPFLGATAHDTIDQVRHADPVPPSRLQPRISKDLETICLKCLRKESSKRYGSATELAEDLQRYLDGRPIVARPVGAVERSWRWCRRNPLGATIVGLVAAIAVVASGMAWRLATVNNALEIQRRAARFAEGEANDAAGKAEAAAENRGALYRQSLLVIHDVLENADRELRNSRSDVAVRKRLILLALDRLAKLEDQQETRSVHPISFRNLAIGQQRLGDIYKLTGDLNSALAHYDQAHESLTRAMRLEPEGPVQYRNLANACRDQALTLNRLGHTLRARDKFQEALELRISWHEKSNPGTKVDHPQTVSAVAAACLEVGAVDLSLGDADSAMKSFNRSRVWYRKLTRNQQLEKLPELALLEHYLAEAFDRLGDGKNAELQYRKAKDKWTKVYADNGKRLSHRMNLLRSILKLGDFYLTSNQVAAAAKEYLVAYKSYISTHARASNLASVKQGLANIEYRIGALLQRAKADGIEIGGVPNGDDPLTHFQACLEIREDLANYDADDMQAKIEKAIALARCGRVEEAEKDAQQLLETGGADPRLIFQAACVFAINCGAKDENVANRCREKANETIQNLVKAGWRDGHVLRTDPDLELIRSDPRFVKMMEKLASPAD